MEQPKRPSIEAIFLEIVELPVADRLRALDERCGGDAALRNRVERLLRADEANHGDPSLELPAAHWPESQVPARVGGYVVNGVAGEGGTGTVLDATHEGTHRRAAVKLIRAGVATAHGRQRLAIEAETLGRLNHEGVARLYEAGIADVVWSDGLPAPRMPFIAMEFVEDAVSITQFARDKALPPRESVRLLAHVARAVHHAHQRGVIHRDLKPGNVLVNRATGVAKVVDFGIARLVDADITGITQTGQVLGTLRYMSPEQASADAKQSVDARSDIYSLGAMLYELLAGRPVIDVPSGSSAAALAQLLSADPPRLACVDRAFKGDLDAIVHMAIDRDPDRRYASAAALADDLEHYLEGKEVAARAPTLAEQVGRLVKRNKATAAALLAVLLSITTGAVAATWGYVRADRALREEAKQRSIAEAQTAEAQTQKAEAEKQRLEADSRRQEAEAVTDFLTRDLLSNAGPDQFPDKAVRDAIVEKLIDPAAAKVGERFKDRPLVEAVLRGNIATTYRSIGRSDLALPQWERVLEINRRLLGDDDLRTITALNNLGTLLVDLGRIREAEPYRREALERRRRLTGDDDRTTLVYMNNLGHLLYAQGRDDEAEELWRVVLDRRRAVFGNDDASTIASMSDLGSLLAGADRFAEAAPLLQEVLDTRKRLLGDRHPGTLLAMGNLALLKGRSKDFPAAEALTRETVKLQREVLGDDHPDTLMSINNLAALLQEMGQQDEAEALYREALHRRVSQLGRRHPDSLLSMTNLAILQQNRGKLDEALVLMKDALEGQRVTLGNDHRSTILTMDAIGNILVKLGRSDEALTYRAEVLQRATAGPAFKQAPRSVRLFASKYADCLDALQRPDEAAAVRKNYAVTTPATTRSSTQPASQPASRAVPR